MKLAVERASNTASSRLYLITCPCARWIDDTFFFNELCALFARHISMKTLVYDPVNDVKCDNLLPRCSEVLSLKIDSTFPHLVF